MKLKGITLVASLVLLGASLLRADEVAKLKAAEELLAAADMETVFTEALAQQLDAQVAQNPELAEVKGAMQAFFEKYMSWKAIKGDMAKVYADAFSEQELAEITKFYKTPTGKKMAQATPELLAKGAAIGQQRVEEHAAELQQMITDAMSKKGGGK